jgi:hypothetical protein
VIFWWPSRHPALNTYTGSSSPTATPPTRRSPPRRPTIGHARLLLAAPATLVFRPGHSTRPREPRRSPARHSRWIAMPYAIKKTIRSMSTDERHRGRQQKSKWSWRSSPGHLARASGKSGTAEEIRWRKPLGSARPLIRRRPNTEHRRPRHPPDDSCRDGAPAAP